MESMTKKEAVESLRLEDEGEVDYALPEPFVDDFQSIMGVNPINCFVWFYPYDGPGRFFGAPIPLTTEAQKLLKSYKERKMIDLVTSTNIQLY